LKLFAIVFLKEEQRENIKSSWREREREREGRRGERDGSPEVRRLPVRDCRKERKGEYEQLKVTVCFARERDKVLD
jgi:hypothetical protein